jgi:hypothetical protein
MHESSNWQNLVVHKEVTRLNIYPSSLIPNCAFAGQLGSALKLLDRSTQCGLHSSDRPAKSAGSPRKRELQLKAMSRRCLSEVGENL